MFKKSEPNKGITQKIIFVAIGTGFIILIPLITMCFTNEVDWTLFDFIVAGFLLFGSGPT